MTMLCATTQQLWPIEAKRLLKQKGLRRRQLRRLFQRVIFPGDKTYDSHRFFFKLEMSELPLFVVVLSTYTEAPRLLDLLAQHNLTLRIVSGRHDAAVKNPDVYLDMSRLCRIELKKSTIEFQGGATQGHVYEHLFNLAKAGKCSPHLVFPGAKWHHPKLALSKHHMIMNNKDVDFPGGSAGSVGVAGIMGCGGVGSLKRTLGLTIDSVQSIWIAVPPTSLAVSSLCAANGKDVCDSNGKDVCASCGKEKRQSKHNPSANQAKLVRASADENADLFWAVRGGQASNFGIIVKTVFRTETEVERTLTYSLSFAWDSAKDALKVWMSTRPSLPNAFNEDFGLFYNHLKTANKEPEIARGVGLGGIYVLSATENYDQAKSAVVKKMEALLAVQGAGKVSF